MIETFLFDMGNVLVHFSHDQMCAQIGALCGRTADEIRFLLIDSGLQWEFERGRLIEAEFHDRLQKLTATELDFGALVHAGSDIFQLNEPMVPLLDALRAQDYRLVLLSNTSISHFQFVSRHFDILDRFDEFVLSCRVGALKPEPAIFEAALRVIDCDPRHCFYSDDIPAYVAAGRGHGLQAEVFTDATRLVEHLAARGVELSVPLLPSRV